MGRLAVSFISQDGGGADVFVHYSEIDASGFKNLDEGQRVEFTVGQGAAGHRRASRLIQTAARQYVAHGIVTRFDDGGLRLA